MAARCADTGRFVPAAFDCSCWFERDRQCVSLSRGGAELFSLWDEDVTQAIEDGFLTTPRFASRASDAEWLPHLIAYAKEVGVLA